MNIKMSNEQFFKIWRDTPLPLGFCQRIVGEIDALMYDDDPVDLTDSAQNVRRLLADLRYLSAICYREYDDLIEYLEDTVATRLHQLKGTRLEIPDEKVNLASKYGQIVNRCVCCGAVIPEGRQVCPVCETREAFSNCDNSPVTMIFHDMQTKMERGVVEAFQQIDINIDKAGVIRALEAERMRRAGELVEVVRCKDCKWSSWDCEWCLNPDLAISGDDATHLYIVPEWFCADGERKEKTDG